MDDLGDKEDDDTGFGSVAGGENEIGDASSKHGGLEEAVFWKEDESIDKTEENAAELDNSKEVVFAGEDTKEDDGCINGRPGDEPRVKSGGDGRMAVGRGWESGVHEVIIT